MRFPYGLTVDISKKSRLHDFSLLAFVFIEFPIEIDLQINLFRFDPTEWYIETLVRFQINWTGYIHWTLAIINTTSSLRRSTDYFHITRRNNRRRCSSTNSARYRSKPIVDKRKKECSLLYRSKCCIIEKLRVSFEKSLLIFSIMFEHLNEFVHRSVSIWLNKNNSNRIILM